MSKLKTKRTGAVPPKKSASAYNIYGKEKRAEILQRNPYTKVTAVVKEMARCWAVMTRQERQKFEDAAKRGNMNFMTYHKFHSSQ